MSITPDQARTMISGALMSEEPRAFFDTIDAEHPCAPYLEQLLALRGVPQNPAYHPEGDAYEHTMLVIGEAAKIRRCAADPLAFMLAALTHDLGKAVSTCLNKKGNWSSVGHENSGVPLISKMLRPLGYDHDTVEYCINMCRLHMRAHTCYHGHAREASTDKMYALSVCPREFVMLVICDARGKGGENHGDDEEAFLLSRLENYEKRNLSSEE